MVQKRNDIKVKYLFESLMHRSQVWMYSCLLSFSVESCITIRLIVKHFLTIYTFHFWLKQSYKCWALSKGATSTNLALLKFKLLWSQLCLLWFPCKNWGWRYSRALAPAVGALVGCLFFCRQNIQGLIITMPRAFLSSVASVCTSWLCCTLYIFNHKLLGYYWYAQAFNPTSPVLNHGNWTFKHNPGCWSTWSSNPLGAGI